MKKLFKNARVVNFSNGSVQRLDILTDGKLFEKIEPNVCDPEAEVFDLCGAYVIPPFSNLFCDGAQAMRENFGLEVDEILANSYLLVKNIFAGAIFVNSPLTENHIFLKDLSELSDKQLDELSALTKKKRAYVCAGQTLDEMGTFDKNFGRPLSQVLEDFGFLDHEPVVVGGNCFDKDDFELFSGYDCDFCVLADDGKTGRRPTNLIQILQNGLRVGIGSGSSAEIDFFGFMRQILASQRSLFEDKNILPEAEVFKMAISDGAKIFNKSERFSGINVGEIANFVAVSGGESLYEDARKSLIYEKSKKDVIMTVANGMILQKNGQLSGDVLRSLDPNVLKNDEILMKNWIDCDIIMSRLKEEISKQ